LNNGFSALSDENEDDANMKWDTIKNTYCDAAEKVVSFRKKQSKEW